MRLASARQALGAAVHLQTFFRSAVDGEEAFPLGVGIGLNAGEALPVEGGYRGGALNSPAWVVVDGNSKSPRGSGWRCGLLWDGSLGSRRVLDGRYTIGYVECRPVLAELPPTRGRRCGRTSHREPHRRDQRRSCPTRP